MAVQSVGINVHFDGAIGHVSGFVTQNGITNSYGFTPITSVYAVGVAAPYVGAVAGLGGVVVGYGVSLAIDFFGLDGVALEQTERVNQSIQNGGLVSIDIGGTDEQKQRFKDSLASSLGMADYNALDENCIDYVQKALDYAGYNKSVKTVLKENLKEKYEDLPDPIKVALDVADDKYQSEHGGDQAPPPADDGMVEGYMTLWPVVLDLDSDGIELTPYNRSGATFDVDGDDYRERTSWVSSNDGILTIDLDGDGLIGQASELAFATATQQEDTDLQALATLYDEDNNNVLDQNDSAWSKFRIWQDINGDGITDEGELLSLEAMGITAIYLESNNVQEEIDGNTIFGYAGYDRDVGGTKSQGTVADVALKASVYGYRVVSTGDDYTIELELTKSSYVAQGIGSIDIDLSVHDFEGVYGADGNDKINGATSDKDLVLSGGKGDDTIVGGKGDDWILGGSGADSLSGGDGDDVIFVDQFDVSVNGGKGSDLVLVFSRDGVDLNLSNAEVEIVRGGIGNDHFDATGANFDVNIDGGFGDDLIIGGDGNDILSGGLGIDQILGNDGNDLIIAGAEDQVVGGAGLDTIFFTTGSLVRDAVELQAEIIIGGSGDDRLWSSASYSGVVFSGGGGSDYLSGNRSDDFLSGGAGDDALRGGVGNDVYKFNRGEGFDDIVDRGAYTQTLSFEYETWINPQYTASPMLAKVTFTLPLTSYDPTVGVDTNREGGGANDTLKFGASIAQPDLVLTFRGQDLYVGIKDPMNPNAKAWELSDRIKLTNWADPQDRIEYFEYDDGSRIKVYDLLVARGIAIPAESFNYTVVTGGNQADLFVGTVEARPEKFIGGNGNDTLHGNPGNDLLIGGDGHDSLVGGSGDDRLMGGDGNDIYLFGRGAGWDNLLDEAVTADSSISLDDYSFTENNTLTDNTFNPNYDYYRSVSLKDYTFNESYTYTDSDGVQRTGTHTFIFDDIRTVRKDAGVDTIKYGSTDITAEDVAMRMIGDDMVIALRDATSPDTNFWNLADQLRVINWADSRNRLEKMLFADGTLIDIGHIKTAYSGDKGDEIVTGDQFGNWLSGGSGSDVLIAGADADIVIGGAGDDILNGGEGSDRLYGGAGNDWASYEDAQLGLTINIATATGIVNEGTYTDTLVGIENVRGSSGNDSIQGSSTDNSLAGGAGADTLDGGAGNDTAFYDESFIGVQVSLGEGSGSGFGYFGTAQGDILRNIENLSGSSHSDTLVGNSGSNILSGGAGRDSLVGGAGIDTASYEKSSRGVKIILNAGGTVGVGGDAEGDTLSGFENLTGSRYNDTLTGDAGTNILTGGDGDDLLSGGAGNDLLEGGVGNDTADYSLSSDVVSIDLSSGNGFGGHAQGDTIRGVEVLIGSDFNDSLAGGSVNETFEGGAGADRIDGRSGSDTASYAKSTAGVSVHLSGAISGGDAAGDILVNIENLIGSKHADTLIGSDDTVMGNILSGGLGNDYLDGGAGNDTLAGGGGADRIIGGTGIDWADYAKSTSGVNVNLQQGSAEGEGKDTIEAVENVVGSAFGDVITGQNGVDNSLIGNGGNDTLDGGTGNDTLFGGQGSDVYFVDVTGDVVIDDGTFGRDRVHAAIDYTLGATIEDLTIGGTGNVNIGVGNALDNRIIGSNLNGELLKGLDGNDTIDGGGGVDEMHGGNGNDVYYVDTSLDRIVEADNAGIDTVYSKVDYSLSAYVENLTLTGNAFAGTGNGRDNILQGSDLANRLDGGDANDTLIGGKGADTLIGGAGSDAASYSTAAEAVKVSLLNAASNSGDALGDSLSGIEMLIGSTFNDTLEAGAAGVTLDGGIGNDRLLGGNGNDYYVVDGVGDLIVETGTSTRDSVQASFEYTLGATLEVLVLNSDKGLKGFGNSGANTLIGSQGNDILDGGAGADRMEGGAGNDVYIVDNVSDVIIEKADEGIDEVRTTVNFTTTLDSNVENLVLLGGARYGTGNSHDNRISVDVVDQGAATLKGGAGNDTLSGTDGADSLMGGDDSDYVDYTRSRAGVLVDIALDTGKMTVNGSTVTDKLFNFENIIGSAFNDTLLGTDGSNYLDGGAGADSMRGGKGNDIYIVDDIGDIINEDPGYGYDRVEASISYFLTEHTEVLILTGRNDINGLGNTLDNVLIGNIANNVLDGGLGIDTMIGGLGNDTYHVNDLRDVVTESQGGGRDRIVTALSYTLARLQNIEELELSGTGTAIGTGNEGDNLIIGNLANNTLYGEAGNDTLDGGQGADRLVGGYGYDMVSYAAADSAVTVNLGTGAVSGSIATGDVLIGIEGVIGSNYNDSLVGGVTHDRLDGGLGADTLIGGLGDDAYVVDSLADVIIEAGNGGRDLVEAGINYTLGAELEELVLKGSVLTGTGNNADNLLIGNNADNTLDGGIGADTLIGGRGDDYFIVDDSRDLVIETLEDGNDTVASYIADWTLGANIEAFVLLGSHAAWITGSDRHDRLYGNAADNTLQGLLGNDSLYGANGNDTLLGEDGDDYLEGGDGTDSLVGGSGNDVIYGGLGDDLLYGGSGDDTIYGGDNVGDERFYSDSGADYYYGGNIGRDIVNYSASATAIRINLDGTAGSGGTAEGDRLFEIDVLQGSNFGDTLGGSALAEAIAGLGGNDTIHGYGDNDEVNGNDGDDWLYGDDGNDNLRGNTGADYLDGGAGIDAARYNLATAGVWADLSQGRGLAGEALGDIFVSIENFIGSNYNDTLVGDAYDNAVSAGAGDDSVLGGASNDRISGDDGNDILYGDAGTDTLFGGNGNDTLYGGGNNDLMFGGAGNDTLVAFSSDTIDGEAGSDLIRFYSPQANSLNYTRIVNFEADGIDKIDLRDLFTQLGYSGTQRQFGSGFVYAGQADGTYSLMLDLDRNGSFEFTLANIQLSRGSIDTGDFIIA